MDDVENQGEEEVASPSFADRAAAAKALALDDGGGAPQTWTSVLIEGKLLKGGGRQALSFLQRR